MKQPQRDERVTETSRKWNSSGRDVRELTLSSLRSQIALVLQESILFSGTIFENIAYGDLEASADDVLATAEAAFVDEFVDSLPEGYETHISERGTTISGGQRIAIARALVPTRRS